MFIYLENCFLCREFLRDVAMHHRIYLICFGFEWILAGCYAGCGVAPRISELGSGLWRLGHIAVVCFQEYVCERSAEPGRHHRSFVSHSLHAHHHTVGQIHLHRTESKRQR